MMAQVYSFLILFYAILASPSPVLPSKDVTKERATLPAGVIRVPTSGRMQSHHSKRQYDSSPITQQLPLQSYWITVQFGTPPQTVPLLVDTGSADTWVQARNSCVVSATSSCGDYACKFMPQSNRSSTWAAPCNGYVC